MKDFILWKRLVHREAMNSKLWSMIYKTKESIDRLYHGILIAPLIVCPINNLPSRDHYPDWKNYSGLCLPYNTCWIEMPSGDVVYGAYIERLESNKVSFTCFGLSRKMNNIVPLGVCIITITANGDLITNADGHLLSLQKGWEFDDVPEARVFTVLECLNVISLLGCKNISLKDNGIDPNEVKRAMRRQNGPPKNNANFVYKTLVITTRNKTTGVYEQNDFGVMPQHMCRAHFAEYGPEYGKGLLFGRYAGRFYVPPHIKGNEENGKVEKDYKVITQ